MEPLPPPTNPYYNPPVSTDAPGDAELAEGSVGIPSAPSYVPPPPQMQMRQAPQYQPSQPQRQFAYQQRQVRAVQPAQMVMVQPQSYPQVVMMRQNDEDCTSLQILAVISLVAPVVGWIAACVMDKQDWGPRKRKAFNVMLVCSVIGVIWITIAVSVSSACISYSSYSRYDGY